MSNLNQAIMRKNYLSHVAKNIYDYPEKCNKENFDFWHRTLNEMKADHGANISVCCTNKTLHLAYVYHRKTYTDNGHYYLAYFTPQERYDIPITKSALQEVLPLWVEKTESEQKSSTQ